MRVVAMVALAIAIGTTAQGESETGQRVTVYVNNDASVPDLVRVRAQGTATQMFAGIGVDVRWKFGRPLDLDNAIRIELVTGTPETFLPGAFAFALPYEGAHIRVFWDRIAVDSRREAILAHVMAHEITHILEGTDRHSDTGVMKARWSSRDLYAMTLRPLPFAPEDVAAIHAGLKARSSGLPTPASSRAILVTASIPASGVIPNNGIIH